MDTIQPVIDTILRSLLAVIALEVLARINGAKQISQLSFYDYITGITIGSMAAVMAIDDVIPFWLPLLAIVIFVLASYVEGKWTLHSLMARKVIDGTPMVIMANGKLLQSHLRKAHLTVNDLLSEARVAGYFNLHDIAFAIMENSGKISFLPYAENAPVTRKDAKLHPAPASLYVNVVIDGELLTQELAAIGKNEEWFIHTCRKHHYGDRKDMLLAIADTNDHLYVYYKDETSNHHKNLL